MKPKPQRSKTARGQQAINHGVEKQGNQGGDLEKVLALIRARPGIRPSEINQLLNREQTDGLRSTLIKRGLIRKEKDGSAMRYYPV
jgi:hypothetical protein